MMTYDDTHIYIYMYIYIVIYKTSAHNVVYVVYMYMLYRKCQYISNCFFLMEPKVYTNILSLSVSVYFKKPTARFFPDDVQKLSEAQMGSPSEDALPGLQSSQSRPGKLVELAEQSVQDSGPSPPSCLPAGHGMHSASRS